MLWFYSGREKGQFSCDWEIDPEELGFSPSDTNLVLREFEKCGEILKHVPGPRDGNWMHVLYQNRSEAQKALNKNGAWTQTFSKKPLNKTGSLELVMHGADRDIVWLQRDTSIYICNLFDTGQASKLLKLERNSLEHLLQHFCAVTANKEYQNADWRLRLLPDEMIRLL